MNFINKLLKKLDQENFNTKTFNSLEDVYNYIDIYYKNELKINFTEQIIQIKKSK